MDDKNKYILKHQDIDVAEFNIDILSNRINYFKIFNNDFSPVNGKENEISQAISFNGWLSDRCIPNSRDGVERLINKYKINDMKQIMLYMHGLSLSDHFWIEKHPFNNKWKDINLFENRYDDLMANLLFDKKMKIVDDLDFNGRINPVFTTGGKLKKVWRYNKDNNKSYLIKGGSKKDYQEPFNEYLAHLLLKELGFEHTPYHIEKINDEYVSVCPCISDIKTEMISGVDLIRKYAIEKSYNGFLNIGIENGCINFKDEINKMIICDYLIDNIDRHWNNFGIVRDAESGKWKALTPIFDNGYSLWNNDFVDVKLVSESMSFADSNEECLKLTNINDYIKILPDMLKIFDEAFYRYENIERKTELRNGLKERIKEIEKTIENNSYGKK